MGRRVTAVPEVLRLHGPHPIRSFDGTIDVSHARFANKPVDGLAGGMHLPVHWDPCFRDWMSLAKISYYGSQHDGHPRQQKAIS